MGELIDDRFHTPGSWMWAMNQSRLGYWVRRKANHIQIPPKGNWSISSADALAEDWEIDPRPHPPIRG